MMTDDEKYMRLALDEAHKALERDEVPIGAVVVCQGRVVGRGHKSPVSSMVPLTTSVAIIPIARRPSTSVHRLIAVCWPKSVPS